VIGNSGVGKTSLLKRFANDEFGSWVTTKIDFEHKTIAVGEDTVKIQIWDTAGQERFRTLTRAMYRNMHAFIVVYDISDRQSFNNVSGWIMDAQKHTTFPDTVQIIVVGNKSDLITHRKVLLSEGQNISQQHGLSFFETSAKENINVNEAFEKVVHEVAVTLYSEQQQELDTVKLDCKVAEKDKKCCATSSQTLSERQVDVPVRPSNGSENSNHVSAVNKWRSEMVELYKKNKSLFESFEVRSGWFISYKQNDGSDGLAERLYRDLKGDNWFDLYYLKTRTRSAMIKGILRRDKFISFLSPSYFKSEWCVMELTTALYSGKTIIPVFNQDVNTAALMLSLVPECFCSLKSEDFIGIFKDRGPYKGQMNKIVVAGSCERKDEFYDSEKEREDI